MTTAEISITKALLFPRYNSRQGHWRCRHAVGPRQNHQATLTIADLKKLRLRDQELPEKAGELLS